MSRAPTTREIVDGIARLREGGPNLIREQRFSLQVYAQDRWIKVGRPYRSEAAAKSWAKFAKAFWYAKLSRVVPVTVELDLESKVGRIVDDV